MIHHENNKARAHIREIVFGMQDGMVSTLGALTGIAVGTNDYFTVILSGIVLIVVESISMSIGSFTSSGTERDTHERLLREEHTEIVEFPQEEEEELRLMFIQDGWPRELAREMSRTASQNKDLMLREMAYRELNIPIGKPVQPLRNGVYMYGAYIAGGLIPLVPYFILSIGPGLYASIGFTLAGLFVLGAATSKVTHRHWAASGLTMLILGSVALSAGYLIGKAAQIMQ